MLREALDGLLAQEGAPSFEVIVVDNGSTDHTAEIAERHPVGAHVIVGEGRGPGLARNLGAHEAQGAWLAFTDADCVPSPSWLREAVLATESADLIQGLVRPPDDASVGPFDRTLWVTSEYGLYETANLLVRKDLFDELGGFTDWADVDADAKTFRRMPTRPFGEDAWFAWRARRNGARTAFSRSAIVFHAVIPGDARGYIEEQMRVRYFPALLRRIPELRDVFAWKRYFLSRQTAAFDAMVGGIVGAILLRSPWPMALAVPYLSMVLRRARRASPDVGTAMKVTLAIAARDAVGFVALIEGSVQSRSALF